MRTRGRYRLASPFNYKKAPPDYQIIVTGVILPDIYRRVSKIHAQAILKTHTESECNLPGRATEEKSNKARTKPERSSIRRE
ncbi:hypothetical protein ACFLU1_03385 [Chloroflexota bacterium]